MNIWDSVHRGLEKASHEAGRIARIQRLRTAADGLARQIQIHQNQVADRTMELFATGRLTQPELLSLCQEIANLQQQLAQLHQELKYMQSFSAPANAPTIPTNSEDALLTPVPPPPPGVPTTYPLPVDSTTPIPPPPPASAPVTVSGMETLLPTMPAPPTAELAFCRVCNVKLLAGHAFCHQCGTAISSPETFQPTIRSGSATQPPEQTSASEGGA